MGYVVGRMVLDWCVECSWGLGVEYWNVSRRMRDVEVYRKPVGRADPVFFVLGRLGSYYYVGKIE